MGVFLVRTADKLDGGVDVPLVVGFGEVGGVDADAQQPGPMHPKDRRRLDRKFAEMIEVEFAVLGDLRLRDRAIGEKLLLGAVVNAEVEGTGVVLAALALGEDAGLAAQAIGIVDDLDPATEAGPVDVNDLLAREFGGRTGRGPASSSARTRL